MSRSSVRVFRSKETLPTRRYDLTDENPPLFVKAGYWTSPYPYTMKNRVQQKKQAKTYPLLGIENEHLRVTVCPDIGGHLFRAIDLATGEDMFHRKAEMLAGSFSVAGAWIPVGIEYNFPVSHSPVTLQPLRSEVRRNDDGSASIFTTDQCLISRLVWVCETRLYPGAAIIENRMTVYNPTSWPHRYYYWLNACVDATDTTRIVLPTKGWTGHGKGEVRPWPVHEGLDRSYMRNLISTSGIFARNCREDYFGIYDPAKGPDGFGVIHIADYRVVPGKKLFTWGNNPRAKAWDLVVDGKGVPYLELQTGLLEEQGDYGFLRPFESMQWRHVFVPVRGLGQTCARATEHAAVNVEADVKQRTVEVRFNVFRKYDSVTATLRFKNRVLGEVTTAVDPADVICLDAKLPAAALKAGDGLVAELHDHSGTLMISHRHVLRRSRGRIDPSTWLGPDLVADNGQVDTHRGSEAEFDKALFWERFGCHAKAETLYREMFEAHPNHLESLVRLASLLNRHGLWTDALARADRIRELGPERHEGPMERGTALWRLGRQEEAEDAFWFAHRMGCPPRLAAYHVAVMASLRGDRARAIEMLEKALQDQPIHPRARAMLASHLNAVGRSDEAIAVLEDGLRTLPCDVVMGLALVGIRPGKKFEATVCEWVRLAPDTLMEAVMVDIDAGLFADALAKLNLTRRGVRVLAKQPVLHYIEAWLVDQLGRAVASRRSLDRAAACGHLRVFPARTELLAIFEWALKQRPKDGLAHLMLARVKYSLGRTSEAIRHWQAAIRLLPQATEIQRSLAFAKWETANDKAAAARALEKVLAMSPNDLVVVVHADVVLAEAGKHDERRRLLSRYRRKHPENDGIAERMVYLHAQCGEYHDLYDLLMGRHWRNVHGTWVRQYAFELSCRMIAEEHEAAGRLEEAIQWHRKCATEPDNLGVDYRPPHEHPEVYCRVGRLLKTLGRQDEAMAEFQQGADERSKSAAEERNYYIALCEQEIGRRAEARKRLAAMHESLERITQKGEDDLGYAWFRDVLALEGLGRKKEAAVSSRKATDLGYDEYKVLRGGPSLGFS